MKIKKILMQSRRDFWADFECQLTQNMTPATGL